MRTIVLTNFISYKYGHCIYNNPNVDSTNVFYSLLYVLCRLNVTKWALLVSLIVVLLVAVKRLRRLMYLAMTICGFDAGLLATVWVKTH